MASSSSRTWHAHEQQPMIGQAEPESEDPWVYEQKEKWKRLSRRIRDMYPPNDHSHVPRTEREFLDFAIASRAHAQKRLMHRINVRQQGQCANLANPSSTSMPPLNGKLPVDNRSTVLHEPTIWRPSHQPIGDEKLGVREWPTRREMEYEGYGRRWGGDRSSGKRENFQRFPPLLRDRSEHRIFDANKLLPREESYPLDEVWRKPDFESIHYPPDPVDDEVGMHLLGSELTRLLNNGGEPVD